VLRLFTLSLFVIAVAGTPVRAAGAPIKIGVRNDMSSVYAVAAGKETVEAVRMAIKDAGPVLGQNVELISADQKKQA
jgi:branched-chain amino acid transport system substrate-binding protein